MDTTIALRAIQHRVRFNSIKHEDIICIIFSVSDKNAMHGDLRNCERNRVCSSIGKRTFKTCLLITCSKKFNIASQS